MFLELFLYISALTMSTKAAHHNHFYRKDYTYFEDFDAFYKLHWDISGTFWNSAFTVCDDEGSQLFYPKEENEWTVVKNLTSSLDETPNTTDVLVGIHDETGYGEFVTVDGQPTPMPIPSAMQNKDKSCVVMDLETGKFRVDPCSTDLVAWRLYVCKKTDEKPCPTVDLGYKYAKEAKKCYKINKRARSWQEAWHTCFMEGAILVDPENNGEIEVIKQIIPNGDRYFAGFRRIFSDSDFYTVKGKKLEDSSFPELNRGDDDIHDCGTLRKDYSYNTLRSRSEKCQDKLAFICEMQARV